MEASKVATIALISLFAAISPGPDFAIVTKNSLGKTFRSGALTALGVAAAIMVHVTYCLFGIAIVIKESPVLFHILKYAGAAYLFYLGIVLLKEKMSRDRASQNAKTHAKKIHTPFVSGFLCNLLNPKCTLFVLSLFTQFIDPNTKILWKVVMGGIFAFIVLAWFLLLSYLITHRLLQNHFARFQLIITKVMGVVLCGLAFYVAFIQNVF